MKTRNKKPRFAPVLIALSMLLGAFFALFPSAKETENETTLSYVGSEYALETEFLLYNDTWNFKNVVFGKTGYLKDGRLCSFVSVPADTDYDIIALSSGGEAPEYKEYHNRTTGGLKQGNNTVCYGIGEHFPAVFEVATNTDFEKTGYKYDWKIKTADGYSDITVPHYESGLTLIIPDISVDFDQKEIAFRVFDGNELKDELVFTVSVSAGDIKYVKSIVLCGEGKNVVSAMPSFFTVTDASYSEKDGKTVLDVTLKAVGKYKFQFNNGYIPVKYYSTDGVCKSPSTKALITDTVSASVTLDNEPQKSGLDVKTVKLEAEELKKGVVLDGGALAVCVPPYADYTENIVKSDFPASFYAVKGNEITYYTTKAPKVSTAVREKEIKTYLGEAVSISTDGRYPLGNIHEAAGLKYTGTAFEGAPSECGSFDLALYKLNYKTLTVERYVIPLTVYEKKDGFTVSFVKNGGAGDMEKITVPKEVGSFTVPECKFIAPKNKTFSHFEYNGERYLPGQVKDVYGNITLTAVWADGQPSEKPEDSATETEKVTENVQTDTAPTDNTSQTDVKEPQKDAASDTDGKTETTAKEDGAHFTERLITGNKSEDTDKLVILILVIISVCLCAGVVALAVIKKRK